MSEIRIIQHPGGAWTATGLANGPVLGSAGDTLMINVGEPSTVFFQSARVAVVPAPTLKQRLRSRLRRLLR